MMRASKKTYELYKDFRKKKAIKPTKSKIVGRWGRGEEHPGRAVVLVMFHFLSWGVNS